MTLSKIVAVCIIVGLGFYALFLYSRPLKTPTIRETTQPSLSSSNTAKASTIFLSPAYTKLTGSQETTIAVMINTNGNHISAAQLEIRYDPSRITISAIKPGDFFLNPLQPVNSLDSSRGRIDFVINLPENQPQAFGEGKLALIYLRRNPSATQSAMTEISFLPKTSVRGNEQNTSLLRSTKNATIQLESLLPQL